MPKTIPVVRQLTLGQLRELAKEVTTRHKAVTDLSGRVAKALETAPDEVDAKHGHLRQLSPAARREARSALIREQIGNVYKPAREIVGLNVKELSRTKAILEEHGASLSNPRAALDIATLADSGVAQMRSTYAASLQGLGPQALRNLAGHALTEQNGVLLAAILSHVEAQKPSDRALSPNELLAEMGPDAPVEEGGFPIFDNYREFKQVSEQLDEALTIGQRLLKGPEQRDPLGKITKGLEQSGRLPKQPTHTAFESDDEEGEGDADA